MFRDSEQISSLLLLIPLLSRPSWTCSDSHHCLAQNKPKIQTISHSKKTQTNFQQNVYITCCKLNEALCKPTYHAVKRHRQYKKPLNHKPNHVLDALHCSVFSIRHSHTWHTPVVHLYRQYTQMLERFVNFQFCINFT